MLHAYTKVSKGNLVGRTALSFLVHRIDVWIPLQDAPFSITLSTSRTSSTQYGKKLFPNSSRSSLRNTNDPVSALIKTISHIRTPKDQIVWRVSFQRSQRFPCLARKASGYICLSIPFFYHPQVSSRTHIKSWITEHRCQPVTLPSISSLDVSAMSLLFPSPLANITSTPNEKDVST